LILSKGGDPAISQYLKAKVNPTWVHNSLQTHVYVENVSIAHLLFEQRLMEDEAQDQDRFGGRSFVITGSPPCAFGDIYQFLTVTTNGETRFPKLQPFPMLLFAHVMEFYHLFQFRLMNISPLLKFIFPPLGKDIVNLQPPIFHTSTSHIFYDDSLARKPPGEGGLGYKPPFTTIMGLSKEVQQFLASDTERESTPPGAQIFRAERGVETIGSKLGIIAKP